MLIHILNKMKRIKTINEFLGFSAKEKENKQLKKDIENLKIEISKFNWLRIVAQLQKVIPYLFRENIAARII